LSFVLFQAIRRSVPLAALPCCSPSSGESSKKFYVTIPMRRRETSHLRPTLLPPCVSPDWRRLSPFDLAGGNPKANLKPLGRREKLKMTLHPLSQLLPNLPVPGPREDGFTSCGNLSRSPIKCWYNPDFFIPTLLGTGVVPLLGPTLSQSLRLL